MLFRSALVDAGGKALFYIGAITAIYEVLKRLIALDSKDPDLGKKVTEAIVSLVARYGFVYVAAVIGTMVGSSVGSTVPAFGTLVGAIAGFIGGVATGTVADVYYGDNVEELVTKFIDHFWPNAVAEGKPGAVPGAAPMGVLQKDGSRLTESPVIAFEGKVPFATLVTVVTASTVML